jgi:hypothetical protein
MINQEDWELILGEIQKARPSEAITQGTVIKRDLKRHVIFMKEFGTTPIPILAFNYEVNYFDVQPFGSTPNAGQPMPKKRFAKKVIAKPQLPKVGDTVLVLKHLGSRRLPKCIGIIQSKNFEVLE